MTVAEIKQRLAAVNQTVKELRAKGVSELAVRVWRNAQIKPLVLAADKLGELGKGIR